MSKLARRLVLMSAAGALPVIWFLSPMALPDGYGMLAPIVMLAPTIGAWLWLWRRFDRTFSAKAGTFFPGLLFQVGSGFIGLLLAILAISLLPGRGAFGW